MNDGSFTIFNCNGGEVMKREKPKYKQIIDAAVRVIADNGYHGSQVSKIAKEAGVADGTIYLYFKNKEDILISVFEEKMGAFIENLEQVVAEEMTMSEKLYKMIENHYTILQQDHHLAIVTQLELRQSSLPLRTKINEVLKQYLVHLDRILQAGKEQGEISETTDLRIVRQMIFGTIDETCTTWVMTGQKYDLVGLTEQVHQLLLQGILKQ